MKKILLFPSDFFNSNKVDPDMEQEYSACLDTNLFDTILFNYDQWFDNDILKINQSFNNKVKVIYRGWMMKPEKYTNFYNELLKKNIELITSPEEYELMHVFPNVYHIFEENKDTVEMKIYPLNEEINVEEVKRLFKRFMIKDYVKSVKGTDFPKYFDQSISQNEFDKWMEKFYEYRGNLLTGGICIKEYINLKKYGNNTNEFRVFYINNLVATISRNSGQGDFTNAPPKELIDRYKDLNSPFYTIDYAELEDETWKVIEAGDGSVSGLSDRQDYEALFRKLAILLDEDS